MSPRMQFSRQSPSARRGFSLIELMIVIVIISILMALILPAIGIIRDRVRTAEIRTEISGFEAGITQFIGEFGQEPPSFIILYEAPTGDPSWQTDTTSPSGLTQSRTTIRQLWPQFDFSKVRDYDQDGDMTEKFILTGDECLLFFLGGPDTITNVADPTDRPVADGFSKNPQDPFAPGGTRTGPFQEFDPDRMIDYENTIGGTLDGAHSYAHKYPSTVVPYLYLSSYGGRGYRPTIDGNMNENSGLDPGQELGDVYKQSTDVAWKNKSYQIISSGIDGVFGIGGGWSNDDGFSKNTDSLDRSADRDNVTNFSSGTLE